MDNFENENFSDGDWEERGELAWNEFDWELFLKRQDKESTRFIRIYNSLTTSSQRIDDTARIMGWDSSDWSMNDFSFDIFIEDMEADPFDDEDPSLDSADQDPYTVHRHPLYIAVQALYGSVLFLFENLLTNNKITLSNKHSFDLMQSINQGKMESLLALQSLDLADYALTVSELKRALKSLNESFENLKTLEPALQSDNGAFIEQASTRLFDIREIWLRVMKDCREELNRRISDED